jgi:hypothetical protein
VKAFALLLVMLAPVCALAQDDAPPPPPVAMPVQPYPPDLPPLVRVRLKTENPSIHLVDGPTKQKICFLNCDREFRVYAYSKYDLVEEEGRTLVSDITFAPSPTRMVLDYRGRMPGVMVPGIVAICLGGAAIVIGALWLFFTAFAVLLGGISNSYIGLYSLPFFGGGVLSLVPGIIMTVIGGRQRYEIVPDADQSPPAPVPPPLPAPAT